MNPRVRKERKDTIGAIELKLNGHTDTTDNSCYGLFASSFSVSSQEEWQRAFNPYIVGSNPVRGVYGEVCKSGQKQTVPKTGEPEKVRGLPRGLGASAVANPTFVVLPPWSNW